MKEIYSGVEIPQMREYHEKSIKLNAVQCCICGDIIKSEYIHDYVVCSCGNVAVDGGLNYLRRCYRTDKFTELSWPKREEE